MAQLKVVSPEQYPASAAQWLAEEIQSAIAAHGSCALCLAGGNTPRAVYEALSRIDTVDWARVDILFGDERAVSPDDAESNYRMVGESLLLRLPVAPLGVHRMEAERADAERAAADYAALLPAAIDVLVLGMGTDGHTASLFPGSPALRATRLVEPATAPVAPHRRLTITPPVIAASRRVAVLVTGAGKAAMVRSVLIDPYDPERLPAQLARDATWLLDTSAAVEFTAQQVVDRRG